MKATRLPVLQLDAHLKSSLAVIRSLGQQGIQITAGSEHPTAMGLFSRYVTDTFLYPSPLNDPLQFVTAIQKQVARIGRCLFLPCSDATLLPLVRHRHLFADQLVFVLPSNLKDFAAAFDKVRTLGLAKELGLEIPQTRSCERVEQVRAISADFSYPVVLKPRHSVRWNHGCGTHRTALFAFSPDELVARYAALFSETGELPVIQEYIAGEEVGVEFLCRDGQVLAACAHRRIRSVSPTGGAGAVTQTIPLAYHGIGERAERLVGAMHWTGPIMVEFKIDRDSNVPVLMETNGRFWGSLPLAIAAGVDFPYLFYRLGSGQEIQPGVAYREGIISRYFVGDLKHLLSVLFIENRMRPIVYPRRVTAIKEFLLCQNPRTSAIFDIRDIKPSLVQPLSFLRSYRKTLFHFRHRPSSNPAFSRSAPAQTKN